MPTKSPPGSTQRAQPREVAASQVQAASGVDSTFAAWLQFEGGLTASILTSFELPESQRLEIYGTKASLIADRVFTAGAEDTEVTLVTDAGRIETRITAANDSYLAMVEHFAAAVRGEMALRRGPALSEQGLELVDNLRAQTSAAR